MFPFCSRSFWGHCTYMYVLRHRTYLTLYLVYHHPRLYYALIKTIKSRRIHTTSGDRCTECIFWPSQSISQCNLSALVRDVPNCINLISQNRTRVYMNICIVPLKGSVTICKIDKISIFSVILWHTTSFQPKMMPGIKQYGSNIRPILSWPYLDPYCLQFERSFNIIYI